MIRKVYKLVRPYGRKRLAGVFAVSLLQGIVQAVGVTSIFPFLVVAADPQRIRNSRFGSELMSWLPPMDNQQLLLATGLGAVAILLVGSILNLYAEYARARYARGFDRWLKILLLRKLASQPYSYFLSQNSGILRKKLSGDVGQFANGILMPLLDMGARSFAILLLLALLVVVHPVIALSAAALFGSFYLIVFRLLGRVRHEVSHGMKEANRSSSTELGQFLLGIKVLKIHSAEEQFIGRYSVPVAQAARLQAKLPLLTSGPRHVIEPLAFGGLVILVLVLSFRGGNFVDMLPVFGVMALAGYRLLPALQLLYTQLSTINTTRHVVDEVYDEFRAAEEAYEPEKTKGGLLVREPALRWNREIRLEKVGFTYPDAERPVIRDLSLSILKNEAVAFVGETGSGKSTLVDLLLGLHRPCGGRILIDDRPLIMDLMPSWRAGIGYVPQDVFLFDDTLARNIAFGIPDRLIDHGRLREVAEMAQILDFIENQTERGFETDAKERGVRLSGGQKQRIALARALYHNPQLLILDEATSALDETTEAEVVAAIEKLRGQLTIIVVAHRLSTIRTCDRVLELEFGGLKSSRTEDRALGLR